MATTNLSYYDKTTIPNAKSFRFGIVVSEWNPDITRSLEKGAIETLIHCGAVKKILFPGMFPEVLSWSMVVKK